MGFTLKVTKGAGVGAEFPFDQNEARLGRTADNDIVVKDTGASRSHARVFEKGGAYWVEDLESANGTKHNGTLISTPKQLKNKDTITIGDVTFTFVMGDETLLKDSTLDEDEEDEAAPKEDPNATLLKPPEEIEEAANRARRNKRSDTEALGLETQPPKREKSARAAPVEREDNNTLEVKVPAPSALKKRDADEGLQPSGGETKEVVVPHARAGGLRRPAGAVDEERSVMTAAEKARRRRQLSQSTSGRLSLMWNELPKLARVAVGALGVLLSVGVLAAMVWFIVPKPGDGKAKGPEPVTLAPNGAPIEASFGLGDDVTYARPDMKIFGFNANSPTRVVAVLHYQAKDISKDEVTIALNGAEQGFVPPDTMDTQNRGLEAVFPPNQVKAGEDNQIVFDNTRNPPADDPWRIWNVWLEILPIPELSAEDTLREVRTNVEKAQKFYELRDVGPDNLFKAWKTYREAWLLLESMPDDKREGYDAVRRSMRDLQPELDKKCSVMLLDFQRVLQAKKKDYRKARQILEDIGRYFPTREHWCHSQSRALLEDLPG